MRNLVVLVLLSPLAAADERFAERTPAPHRPYEHSAANAGTDRTPRVAQPSVTRDTALGYVNGTTFGTDYALFGRWPARVFPGLWSNSRKPSSFANRYATDGPIHVPDPVAAQPFRRAVKEAKAERRPHD